MAAKRKGTAIRAEILEGNLADGHGLAYASLSSHQRQAAELLALGWTKNATAEAVGVTERSIFTWESDPTFRQAVAELAQSSWRSVSHRVAALAADAIDFLAVVLADDDRPTRDRLRAAEIILKVSSDPNFRPNLVRDRATIERQIKAGY